MKPDNIVLRIYDYMSCHPWYRRLSLLALVAAMSASLSTITFEEDITDFLPLDESDRDNLELYQNISGASDIVVIFDGEPDDMVAAVNTFTSELTTLDTLGWTIGMIASIDEESVADIAAFVYDNIPYFLTPEDYQRMDSVLMRSDYVAECMQRNRDVLMLPTPSMVSDNIGRDPLWLFTPVLQRLQQYSPQSNFEQYDGCILTPDMKHAIVLIPSVFGNGETRYNTQLLALVDQALLSTASAHPNVTTHTTGGPVIAVENARQIRYDTILTTTLAVVLIFLLLLYAFRSMRNMALTALTIVWGLLFALSALALIQGQVSLIIIGISCVIVGIAFNYPLHLINHLSHQSDVRQALREIVRPLLIGNVTTVGAFMALIPLKSTALCQLGLFATFMLAGTIVFVLIYLPHYVRIDTASVRSTTSVIHRIAQWQVEKEKWLVVAVVLLTFVLAYYAPHTGFDADLNHINHMSAQQRRDIKYFQSVLVPGSEDHALIYYPTCDSTFDQALMRAEQRRAHDDSIYGDYHVLSHHTMTSYICSKAEQRRRLQRWNGFVAKWGRNIELDLNQAASQYGFRSEAFVPFADILNAEYEEQEHRYFEPLTSTIFKNYHYQDSTRGLAYVVDQVYVPATEVAQVECRLPQSFDIRTLNSRIADSLTSDFNYIGIVCSAIVFFFLWYSFGKLQLAIIAFIPMAVSWIWILGIMALLGIKFNIVNIILATFIFGQGDDYTIFVTEGCIYERRTGRPMLATYKHSIILSALIMFAGIGVLVLARHPALNSLGTVTIIGMVVVVLMANLIPPVIFKVASLVRSLRL